jgi:hypothetical protein
VKALNNPPRPPLKKGGGETKKIGDTLTPPLSLEGEGVVEKGSQRGLRETTLNHEFWGFGFRILNLRSVPSYASGPKGISDRVTGSQFG